MASATVHALPVADVSKAQRFLASSVRDNIHIVILPPDGPPHGDQPKPYGRWFGEDTDAAAAWAVAQNAKGYGAYWTVNIVRPRLDKKPSKADILGARFLHVDIDPPFDRSELLEQLDGFKVPPSFVIDSGAGLQAFWRSDYIAENWPAVETLNQSLEDVFGGDHCWNVDRLMRLPGTVNYPNKLKRSKGRIPALAAIAVEDAGEAVDPEHMRRILPPPRTRQDADRSTVSLDGVRPLGLGELGITTLNRLHEMIMTPRNPDRSSVTYGVTCEMARQGYSDEEIAGVLLNADLPVSGHCLDQASPLRAVKRAIGAARAVTASAKPGNRESGATASPEAEQARNPEQKDAKPLVSATPFVWRELADIPLRPWVFGRWLLRGTVTAVVAPGGVGKSSLMASLALSLATGRSLLSKSVWEGPQRAWLWNLEDDADELARQLQAAAKHHGITAEDCVDRLFVDSALEGAELCTAVEVEGQFRILRPVVDALVEELITRKIDVLSVDPFVSSHQIPENDNSMMDAVVKEWARVAKRANCSIILVHHTRKLAGQKVTAEMARGAVALIAAARSTLVLNRMEPEDADRLGIEGEEECRRYFTVGDDKHNRAPAEKAQWYRLVSVDLGNGGMNGTLPGDSIGVVEPWTMPDPFEGLTGAHLYKVQATIDRGTYRYDPQSKVEPWAGVAVAEALGFDLEKKSQRVRVSQMLKTWISEGVLMVVEDVDGRREKRKYIRVGRWQNDAAAPVKGTARQGTAGNPHQVPHHHPTPEGVGGTAGAVGGKNEVRQNLSSPSSNQRNDNPALGRKRGPILAPGETDDEPVPGWEDIE